MKQKELLKREKAEKGTKGIRKNKKQAEKIYVMNYRDSFLKNKFASIYHIK